MNTLKDLIQEALLENTNLTDLLTKFNNQPAVFYQMCPRDDEEGWILGRQYPRIDYTIEFGQNTSKKCIGTMQVRAWSESVGTLVETIAPVIKECFQDIFIQTLDNRTYCLVWEEKYEEKEDKQIKIGDKTIILKTLVYQILEYHNQETADPDPILALTHYCKNDIPNGIYIGMDKIDKFLKRDTIVPIFYFRLINVNKERENSTIIWLKSSIAIHVMGKNSGSRLKWVLYLLNRFSREGELSMSDNSPLFIKKIEANMQADYLREGQILLEVEYGLLRENGIQHNINMSRFNINI
jgi:hypothetical protein